MYSFDTELNRRRDNRHEPELLIQTNVNFVNQDQTSSKPWFCALLFNTITICAVGLLALALARSHYRKYTLEKSEVLLFGGAGENEGNVYVMNPITLVHGPVCDDGWGIKSAHVVCRQLGFTKALFYTVSSYFGKTDDDYALSNVKCRGREDNIGECRLTHHHDCGPGEAAGVVCQNGSANFRQSLIQRNPVSQTPVKSSSTGIQKNTEKPHEVSKIELVGGNSTSEGNLYALNPNTGIFGPVCDNGWSMRDASVICKQLGFSNVVFRTIKSYYGKVNGQFSMIDVICYGNEPSLDKCNFGDPSSCSPEEGAGVICDEGSIQIRLVGGNTSNSGNVFVRNSATGYMGPVCDQDWSIQNARVVCRQLGYDAVTESIVESFYGLVPNKFSYVGLNCNGTESNINQCASTSTDPTLCSPKSGAGVNCYKGTLELKLVGGSGPHEGDIVIYNPDNGIYGPICDEHWTIQDASVICQQLGYNGARAATLKSQFGNLLSTFAFNNVKCNGDEKTIENCKYNNTDDCESYEAAGVICSNTTTVIPQVKEYSSNVTGLSKMISIGGFEESSVEAVNLDENDPKDTCENLIKLPFTLYGALSGLVNQTIPVVCGGIADYVSNCHCLAFQNASWQKVSQMNTCTALSSKVSIQIPAVSADQESLVSIGGITIDDVFDSVEVMDPNFRWLKGIIPNLPLKLIGSCAVKWNSTTIFVMNGFDTRGRAPSSASFFYTIGDKTWKNGPNLPTYDYSRSCGVYRRVDAKKNLISSKVVVLGGAQNFGCDVLDIQKYEGLGQGWTSGPDLGDFIFGSQMIEMENTLFLVGGWIPSNTKYSHVFKWTEEGDNSSWKKLSVKVKTLRVFQANIVVPDNIFVT